MYVIYRRLHRYLSILFADLVHTAQKAAQGRQYLRGVLFAPDHENVGEALAYPFVRPCLLGLRDEIVKLGHSLTVLVLADEF